jgi:hypothetical protein
MTAERSAETAAVRRNIANLPRVMLLIDEKSLGTIATAEVEAMGSSLLHDNNVQVVDQDMARSNISKDQQLMKMAGDNRAAAALGLQFGSEVVVVGEAVAKPSARRIGDSNLRTYQAAVTIRAIRTDNSKVIASASETESIAALEDVAGSAQALKKAGKKAFETLIPKMIEAWEREGGSRGASPSHHAALSVGGVDQAWKLKAIRDKLRGMTDKVQNVVQRSYTSGLAVFELDSTIPPEELSEELILSPPEGLKFQSLDVGQGKISLRAVAAPAPQPAP